MTASPRVNLSAGRLELLENLAMPTTTGPRGRPWCAAPTLPPRHR